MGTWFDTRCAPGARMWASGLLYPLFVVQITWFDMAMLWHESEVGGTGVESHEIHNGINVQVGLTLRERTVGHIKLLLSKGGSLMRDEVD